MDTATNGKAPYSHPMLSTDLTLGDMMTAYQGAIKDVADAKARVVELEEQLAVVKKTITPELAKLGITIDFGALEATSAKPSRRPKMEGGTTLADKITRLCATKNHTVPELSKALGGKVTTLRTVVAKLAKAGKIKRVSRGVWCAK